MSRSVPANKLPDETQDRIHQLLVAGESRKRIADAVGCAKSTVDAYYERNRAQIQDEQGVEPHRASTFELAMAKMLPAIREHCVTMRKIDAEIREDDNPRNREANTKSLKNLADGMKALFAILLDAEKVAKRVQMSGPQRKEPLAKPPKLAVVTPLEDDAGPSPLASLRRARASGHAG